MLRLILFVIFSGTKADDVQNNQVLEAEGRKLAKSMRADDFIQNSAKTKYNIDETFARAISVALRSNDGVRNIDCCTVQ